MDTRDKVVSAGEYGEAKTSGVDALTQDKAPDAGRQTSGNQTSGNKPSDSQAAGSQAADAQSPSLAFTSGEPAQDVGGEVGKKGFSLQSLNPMNLKNVDFKNLKLNRWQIAGVVAGGVALTAGVAGLVYWRVQSRPKTRLEKLSHAIGIDRIDLSKASPRRLTHMAKAGLKHVPMPHVDSRTLKKARSYFS